MAMTQRTLRILRYFVLVCAAMSGAHAQTCPIIFHSSFERDEFITPLKCTKPLTDAEAAKFLTQATFGPTYESIDALKSLGFERWLYQQRDLPASSALSQLDARIAATVDFKNIYHATLHDIWFNHALYGQDQLRQRVAYALSQILVVSSKSDVNVAALSVYYDILVNGAFGNYRDLLESITLSPAMGRYLSMLKNRKPGLGKDSTGVREDLQDDARPDENYAREIMQLFSIGLVMLNPDGTVKRDNGNPIPTYSQETIKGFAHVFTGWNYGSCKAPLANPYYNAGNPESVPFKWWHFNWCREIDDTGTEDNPIRAHRYIAKRWRLPMKPWGEGSPFGTPYHASEGTKQLLDYPGVELTNGVLPAGGTARDNLTAALDNIFHHPNVPPFVAFRLIQRLTTSNPSPAYIARVAAKFIDNGSGERGDLFATVKAVLLDPEAREPSQAPANFGKIREPIIRLANLYRAFNGQSRLGGFHEPWIGSHTQQMVLNAPSVFNYYLPSFQQAGVAKDNHLFTPELQMMTDSQINQMARYLEGKVYYDAYVTQPNPSVGDRTMQLNYQAFMPYLNQPEKMVDELALLLTYDTLSAADRTRYIAMLKSPDYPSYNNDWNNKLRIANLVNLIINSPAFIVETH